MFDTIRGRRSVAFVAALALCVEISPAWAVPSPRSDEWWFSSWDVQRLVWPITTGTGVTVAVLDSGVNARLSELAGVVLPGTDTTGGGHGDGRTDVDGSPTPFGHGTSMAAAIAGQGGTSGMVGVAPGVKILPVIVNSADARVAYTQGIADGIRYATDHGAGVINISQGQSFGKALTCTPDIQAAVDDALRHDIVIVASDGNTGNTVDLPEEPASCPGVIAVGAVDSQAVAWSQTQRQPYVAVAAPGVNVGSVGKFGQFVVANGTSFSTALTSAVVALVRSRFPHMSAREVVRRIIATAYHVGPPGPNDATGYGIVRPYHALTDQIRPDSPNPVFAAWDKEQHAAAATAAPVARPIARQVTHTSSRIVLYILIGIAVLAAVVIAAITAVSRTRRSGGGPAATSPPPSGDWPPRA